MRTNILSFACGVLLLQLQGALPRLWVIAGIAICGLAGMAATWGRQSTWRPVRQVQRLRRVLLAFACLLLGFAWAGTLACLRLDDALPEAWESRDIQITGVVASLPQRFERGERFVFDVESIDTEGATVPGRILLSWYRSWDELDEIECA